MGMFNIDNFKKVAFSLVWIAVWVTFTNETKT